MGQKPEGLSLMDTEWWLTNRVFSKHRGQLQHLTAFLREIVFNAESPYYCPTGKSLAKLNFFSGDFKTLADKLVQLTRDGHPEMAEEIIRALGRFGRLLPGEKQEWTNERYTLLLFDPEKTLLLLKAILENSADSYHLNRYFKESDIEKTESPPFYLDTHRLCEMFPSIKFFFEFHTGWKRGRSGYSCGCPCPAFILKSAFLYEVVADFHPYLPRDKKMILLCPEESQIHLGDFWGSYDANPDESVISSWWKMNNHQELRFFSKCFLFLFKGKRDEILKCFPRLLQDRIASWEFDIPNRYEYYRNWRFGLHPDSEHAGWERKYPMFVPPKNGVSRDMGAIFFPDIATPERVPVYSDAISNYVVYHHDWHQKKKLPFRVLFQPYNQTR